MRMCRLSFQLAARARKEYIRPNICSRAYLGEGGSGGARDPPFVNRFFLSKQQTIFRWRGDRVTPLSKILLFGRSKISLGFQSDEATKGSVMISHKLKTLTKKFVAKDCG